MSNYSVDVATTSPTRTKNGVIFLLQVRMGSWWNFFACVRVLAAKLLFSPFIVCFNKEPLSDVIDNKETVSNLTLDSSIAL